MLNAGCDIKVSPRKVAANTGNVPVAASTGNVPVVANTGNVPVAASRGKVPVAANTGKVPVAANTGKVPVAANTGKVPVAAICFPSFGKGGVGVVCQKMFDRFRKIMLGPCFTYHPQPLLWKRRGVVRLLSIFLTVVLMSAVATQVKAQGGADGAL